MINITQMIIKSPNKHKQKRFSAAIEIITDEIRAFLCSNK